MMSARNTRSRLGGAISVAAFIGCGARTDLPTEALGTAACSVSKGSVTTLSSGQEQPRELVLDARNAYVADWGTTENAFADGAIVQIPLCGGTPVVLATAQAWPDAIAVDATHVYWANAGAEDSSSGGVIRKVPIGGGAIVTLAAELDSPSGIAVDATSVYWMTATDILSTSIEGGPVVTLATGQTPVSIALDSSSVYWANGAIPSSLMKVSTSGGVVTTLTSAPMFGLAADVIGSIAVSGGYVYWATGDEFVMALSLSDGSISTLATNQAAATGLVVDATDLFWGTGSGPNGAIMRLPLTGGTPTTVARQGAISIGLNASLIGWTDLNWGSGDGNEGSVMVTPK